MDRYQDESIDTATGNSAPPELSTNRVHDIFSSIANRYEMFNAVSSMGAYRIWLNKMVSLTCVAPASAVIDIAGGTGDVTFALAKAKHPAIIVCTDLVPKMLEVAETHYEKGASDGVPVLFQTANAQILPYEDNTFDIATMAYGLRNMPERHQALSEIFRILRPGGQLVCLDFSTPQNALWHAAYDIYLTRMIPFWGKLITGDDSGFLYLSNSIKAFPDQAGVAHLMENAGFTNVEWHDCMGGIACIHVAYKPGSGAELSSSEETLSRPASEAAFGLSSSRSADLPMRSCEDCLSEPCKGEASSAAASANRWIGCETLSEDGSDAGHSESLST